MRFTKQLLFCVSLFVWGATGERSVSAAIVVDTAASQLISEGELATFRDQGGQSFEPTFSNVAGARIGIRVNAEGSIGEFTLELRDTVNGVAIAGASGSTSSVSGGFFEVVFAAPIAVVPGDQYFWIFTESNSIPGGANQGSFLGTTSVPDPYENGFAFTNVNTGSAIPFTDFDFQFQTLFDNATAVPEPSASFLLLGLIAATATRRRRKTI